MSEEHLPTWRKRWTTTLGNTDQQTIVDVFQQFVDAGKEFPPTLPEFKAAIATLVKQNKLKSWKQESIEGVRTPEVAEYYKLCIKRVLKIKPGNESFPWLAKIEDATVEQLDLIREDLVGRGFEVKKFSEIMQ